jgi:hypothetical protein
MGEIEGVRAVAVAERRKLRLLDIGLEIFIGFASSHFVIVAGTTLLTSEW